MMTEQQILQWNRKHCLQARSTPFFTHQTLACLVDPNNPLNSFDAISNAHLDVTNDLPNLNDTEQVWIHSLTSLVNEKISL
jgi:hypothetical protein